MKKSLLLLILIVSCQPIFAQNGFEVQLFNGITDFNRTKLKFQTSYEHFNGRSHLGLNFERFKLSSSIEIPDLIQDTTNPDLLKDISYNAFGFFGEFGYTFTNFKIPIEMTPLINFGWFTYDKRWGQRFLGGMDLAYIITPNIKLHLLVTIAQEHWTVAYNVHRIGDIVFGNDTYYYQKRTNNGDCVLLGISYNP